MINLPLFRSFFTFKVDVTPPKINMEPKNWWFVDVSPFSHEVFSGSSRSFSGGVYPLLKTHPRSYLFVALPDVKPAGDQLETGVASENICIDLIDPS